MWFNFYRDTVDKPIGYIPVGLTRSGFRPESITLFQEDIHNLVSMGDVELKSYLIMLAKTLTKHKDVV